MNFQNLLTVGDPQHYLNTAFKQAKDRADIIRDKITKIARRPLPTHPDKRRFIIQRTKLNTSKDVELERIRIVQRSLCNNLQAILTSFPAIDTLPPFYLALLKTTIDYPQMKRSLGAVHWAEQKITEFYHQTDQKIKRTYDFKQINGLRRHFYGRASSLLKQIAENFAFLEQCRRIMKRYPAIKTSVPTVALAGYPNVGKSTLLRALTSSTPDIAPYPFTTKELNVGYMHINLREFQIIDVPGTFDRPFNEMNAIEKQAYLALQHLAQVIVFVLDPTETCGYSSLDQQKLLKRFEQTFNLPIIRVMNKSDLIQENRGLVSQSEETYLTISAEKGVGIDILKQHLEEMVTKKNHRQI